MLTDKIGDLKPDSYNANFRQACSQNEPTFGPKGKPSPPTTELTSSPSDNRRRSFSLPRAPVKLKPGRLAFLVSIRDHDYDPSCDTVPNRGWCYNSSWGSTVSE